MQKILYDAMLSRIKKEIISNKEEIKKLEEIDNKYSKNKIQLENITKIVEYYKTKEIENLNEELYVYCNGNTYIVLNLAMIAIIKNISMKINIDDNMLTISNRLEEKNNILIESADNNDNIKSKKFKFKL